LCQHEDEVEGKKRKKKRVNIVDDDDDEFTSPEEDPAPSTSRSTLNREAHVWQMFDVDGDCTFCYHCLDSAGISVVVCDRCFMSVHKVCSNQLDRSLKVPKSMPDDTSAKWWCHYCRKVSGVKHQNPINAFSNKVNGQVSTENYGNNKKKLRNWRSNENFMRELAIRNNSSAVASENNRRLKNDHEAVSQPAQKKQKTKH
jgi:hypothetical protein